MQIRECIPNDDLEKVVQSEIKCIRGFLLCNIVYQADAQLVYQGNGTSSHISDIYFLQDNENQRVEALALRDAVLSLRRQGAFVAVPLKTVNLGPRGPHPAGSYEIWCPSESFVYLYSYLCQNRGTLSILVHPLTREEREDHDSRKAWIGPPWPIDLSKLPKQSEVVPLQYPSLELGYSSKAPKPSLRELRERGAGIEEQLKREPEAAPAPLM